MGGRGDLAVVSDVPLFAEAARTGLLTGVFFTFTSYRALSRVHADGFTRQNERMVSRVGAA